MNTKVTLKLWYNQTFTEDFKFTGRWMIRRFSNTSELFLEVEVMDDVSKWYQKKNMQPFFTWSHESSFVDFYMEFVNECTN